MKLDTTASLYLLYGTEGFLLEEAKRKLIQSTLSDDELEFNLSVYSANETSIDVAIDDAETLPFIGEKRVVIVKDALFLTGQKEKEKVEHNLNRLESYIENPSLESVFILIAPYEKLDERKKIVKLLKTHGIIYFAKEMDTSVLKTWIKGKFSSQNLQIEENAIEVLMEVVGTNLTLLDNEIEKISLYVGSGKVEDKDIYELATKTLEQNIFVLIEKAVQKKVEETLRSFYDLLDKKEEPIKILSLLSSQFRLIYSVKLLNQSGYGQSQIASTLKVHPFRVKLAGKQASHFTELELQWILKELADIDYGMKSGKMDKVLLLEMFFVKLKTGLQSVSAK